MGNRRIGETEKGREGRDMAQDQGAARQGSRIFTEDWLAVVVGLALVALVLTGILKNIP
jgi:hypothetical protein